METMNIHLRINRRANQINKAKAFGLTINKANVFLCSLNRNGQLEPICEQLYRFQRRKDEPVFYN